MLLQQDGAEESDQGNLRLVDLSDEVDGIIDAAGLLDRDEASDRESAMGRGLRPQSPVATLSLWGEPTR